MPGSQSVKGKQTGPNKKGGNNEKKGISYYFMYRPNGDSRVMFQ
jgi:hypothetical protein